MDTVLIIFLLAVVVWAIWSLTSLFRWRGDKGGFFWRRLFAGAITAVVLIPILLFFLGEQAGAKAELEALGITPHPALGASSGAATGIALDGGTIWAFDSDADPATILEFYQEDPATRPEWRVTSESPGTLILSRGSRRLTILAGSTRTGTTVTYRVQEGDDAGGG